MRESDRLLAGTVGRNKGLFAVVAALHLFQSAAGLLLPLVLSDAIDVVLGQTGDRVPFLLVCALLLTMTVAEIAGQIAEAKMRATATARLRHDTFSRIFRLGLSARNRFTPGDLLSRSLESTAEAGGAGLNLLNAVFAALTACGGLVALFLIDWRLVLVFALGVPAVWLLARMLIRRTTTLTGQYQQALGELSDRFVDAVGGARTIRASATLDREVERVLRPVPRLHAAGTGFWEAQRRAGWYLSLLSPGLQIGVLATAGYGVVAGRLTPGQMLAAQLYLTYAMRLLSQVGIFAELGRARGSAERLREVFAAPLPRRGDRPLPPGEGALALRDITVRADDRLVLDGLTLDIPAGSTLAVVGASGSGKTTLALVAGAALPPDGGEVRLDGADLAETDRGEVRDAIAYAFERPHPLGETVADLIGYGDRPVTATAVREAARAAHADGFISRLPLAYQTPLAELRLSGGEWQRLGLARAVCGRARVVIFDDAMSSVDTATENEIGRAMDESLRGTTRVVVAHRITTAASADLVAWLDGGRVRAVGPHRKLGTDPAYRAVFGTGGDRGDQDRAGTDQPGSDTADAADGADTAHTADAADGAGRSDGSYGAGGVAHGPAGGPARDIGRERSGAM
ncbi:ABC transporter ATP-binding protein [Streptomyces sp. 35G-GA-8]|uniref:ABC transporter ATP-binding protein n=1 Tax=Streptomyces sp. 35G-GA-8 TaxID=2939434 RepID=UPI00201F5FD9|nr:ABC transporter ATP-binding protein [Streptomyces sp. 35G-GA-8]MCL7381620.1 ABC transporter ATP-binding protein/permease [Streptomyces sp. 35G-GA-8]